MAQAAEKSLQKVNYGLRREILSPMEGKGTMGHCAPLALSSGWQA